MPPPQKSALFVSLLSFSLYIFRYRISRGPSRRKVPRLNKRGFPRGVSPSSVQNANSRWNEAMMEGAGTHGAKGKPHQTRTTKKKARKETTKRASGGEIRALKPKIKVCGGVGGHF